MKVILEDHGRYSIAPEDEEKAIMKLLDAITHKMMHHMDEDGNGDIDLNEWIRFLASVPPPMTTHSSFTQGSSRQYVSRDVLMGAGYVRIFRKLVLGRTNTDLRK